MRQAVKRTKYPHIRLFEQGRIIIFETTPKRAEYPRTEISSKEGANAVMRHAFSANIPPLAQYFILYGIWVDPLRLWRV